MNNSSQPERLTAGYTGDRQPETDRTTVTIRKINKSNRYPASSSRQIIKDNTVGIHEPRNTSKVNVSVCVGTGCYLRGSYDVLDKFTELTRQLNLEDYIDLKGTFCLENCDSGVSIKVNDEIITGVNKTNAEQIFKTHIAMKTDPPWASK